MVAAKKIKKILFATLALLALVTTASFAYIYLASENYLKDVSMDPGFVAMDRQDAAFIERGRHIARTRGCFGCHGQQLEGRDFQEEWDWVGRAVAPNLARFAREHEDATIEAGVRQGIGHDGKALWSMPSYNFALLSDADMSALIAFLRSADVVENDLPKPSLGWAARLLIVRGQAMHMAEWSDHMPALLLGERDDPQLVHGEYLAKTMCNECHGFDLRGQVYDDGGTPDLAILTAYSDADFHRLMQSGEAIGGRTDLGLMTMVARDRFAHLKENELNDLLAYLRTLPGTPVDRNAAWRKLQ